MKKGKMENWKFSQKVKSQNTIKIRINEKEKLKQKTKKGTRKLFIVHFYQ